MDLRNWINSKVPSRWIKRIVKSRDPQVRLPRIPWNASPSVKKLRKAWELAQLSNANSPGQCVSYYSLEFEGYEFPGERPWSTRWELLQSVTDFQGKRVLEIGCNLALLSCCLLKDSGASDAIAVDYDSTILKAASLAAEAHNVTPVFVQQDLNSKEDWESRLNAYNPDLVVALSILNWIDDKERFVAYLGQFDEVIFEGHDSFEKEGERFKKVGFEVIRLVGMSERARPILYCSRIP